MFKYSLGSTGNGFVSFLVLGGLDCFMASSFIGFMVLGFCPWVSFHTSILTSPFILIVGWMCLLFGWVHIYSWLVANLFLLFPWL